MTPAWRLFQDRRTERTAYLSVAVVIVGAAAIRYGWLGGLVGFLATGAAWNCAIFIAWLVRGRPREANPVTLESPGLDLFVRAMGAVEFVLAAILLLVPFCMFFGVPFIVAQQHGVGTPLALGAAVPIGSILSASFYWALKRGWIVFDD